MLLGTFKSIDLVSCLTIHVYGEFQPVVHVYKWYYYN